MQCGHHACRALDASAQRSPAHLLLRHGVGVACVEFCVQSLGRTHIMAELTLQLASPQLHQQQRPGRPSNRGRASTAAMDAGMAGSPRLDYDLAPGGSESPALPEVQALGEMLGASMGGKLVHNSPPVDDEEADEEAERERAAAARARALQQTQVADAQAGAARRQREREEADAERERAVAQRERAAAQRAADANGRLAKQRQEEEEEEQALADRRWAEAEADRQEAERTSKREAALAARWKDEARATQMRDRAKTESAELRERQEAMRANASAQRAASLLAKSMFDTEQEVDAEAWRRDALSRWDQNAALALERKMRADLRAREWTALELQLTLKAKPYARDFDGLVRFSIRFDSRSWLVFCCFPALFRLFGH